MNGSGSEHKAQELGDLYFAADNYVVALEYYRRALDSDAGDAPRDREGLLRFPLHEVSSSHDTSSPLAEHKRQRVRP